jgi:hypothetical protein
MTGLLVELRAGTIRVAKAFSELELFMKHLQSSETQRLVPDAVILTLALYCLPRRAIFKEEIRLAF